MFKILRRARYRPTVGSVASHAVIGAAAGFAATWVMGKVTGYLYAREDPEARRREDAVRGNKSSYGVAAERLAAVVRSEPLSDEERSRFGSALHWGLGTTAGALYGATWALYPEASWRRGLAFGAGFFLVADELINGAFGLTPPPRAFPWQAHARGLAGHLVYGITTDAALRGLEGPVLRASGLRRHVTP